MNIFLGTATPAFLVFLLTLGIWILSVRKEYVIVPLIVAMCFLPADISIKVGTLDFTALRVLVLLSFFKMFIIQIDKTRGLNVIDKLFIANIILGAVVYVIASEQKWGAFVLKCGTCVDTIFLYFVLRKTIDTKDSALLIIRVFSICVIALLPFVIFEFYSEKNLFSIFGREAIAVRDGEIRVATTFSHAILFGSFSAALVPILFADYKINLGLGKLIPIVCCIFFVYASSSSGPIVVLAGAIFFIAFFAWRQFSRLLAWFILISAITIHFVRNNPFWYFIYVGISVKESSTGWHRVLLMDAAVKEFWNWWFLGYGDVGPQWHIEYWPYTYAEFTDVTNQYLLEGVKGGFFSMLLFIFLCYKSVKILGSYSLSQELVKDQWLWWGFMVMMIVHCMAFLSVSYFGQITMLLYLTIAVAAYACDEMVGKSESVSGTEEKGSSSFHHQ